MDKDLIEYLPPILKKVEEFKQICKSEQDMLSFCEKAVQTVFDNQFIESANSDGILRYEKIMGISSRGTDTLEDRRFRVKNRIVGDLPYTKEALGKRLSALCGKDGYTLLIEYDKYNVKVQLELTAKNQYEEVGIILRDILPANLTIAVSIRYNQYYKLSRLTHKELSEYTHKYIRNEVLKNGSDNN